MWLLLLFTLLLCPSSEQTPVQARKLRASQGSIPEAISGQHASNELVRADQQAATAVLMFLQAKQPVSTLLLNGRQSLDTAG